MNLDAWIAEGEDDVKIIGRNSKEDGNEIFKSASPKMKKQESRKMLINNNNNNNSNNNNNYNNNNNNSNNNNNNNNDNNNYDNDDNKNNSNYNNSNPNVGSIPQPSAESQKVLQNARDFRVTFLGKPFEMVR